ncbi:MAG: cohesin domain-containing protein [Candidatus Bathyarchaeota archaeon]|nr:cohesin domain-containing protein [Candidatus Bathyarchaeota archaeon]MDH5494587.1 cohesin domain-containing protein [Candidatus Bathyarchaeota archaeon]
MNIKVKRLVAILFAAMLTFSALAIAIPMAYSQVDPSVSIEPSYLEFGPAPCVGTVFTIECWIRNINDPMLYGLDIQISWDPYYLEYLDHTATIPVEDFPGGVLHKPGMFVTDNVDPIAGTYAVAYACMDPALEWSGDGTVFNMTFRIKYQPSVPEPDANIDIAFTYTGLSDKPGDPLPTWDEFPGLVVIKTKPFEYPNLPYLKVDPPEVSGLPMGTTFEVSVYIMGINTTDDTEHDLDPFWDVAGFDIVMNFKRANPPQLLLEAVDVDIDPDGDFGSFFYSSPPVLEVEKSIDNVAGTVHVVFLGVPDEVLGHDAPYGVFRVFSVTFNALYESDTYPPPAVELKLKNPLTFTHRAMIDADSGLIDLGSPVSELWTMVNPDDYGTNVELTSWVDVDVDYELSAGDKIRLDYTTSDFWHEYVVDDLAGTLKLTQLPFQLSQEFTVVDGIPSVWDPPVVADTGTYNDKDGNPYWTGNISVGFEVSSVNSIYVTPPFSAPYYLVEGTDFIVHAGTTNIELLTPLDEQVINEYYIAGVTGMPPGWPAIAHMASGFQSIWVDFGNGTARWARNLGFETGPPNEYWYEGDWPNEIEGWWALDWGYPSPEAWPVGTEYWINYTVPAEIVIDYNAVPNPTPYVFEYDGTYTDFLALGDLTNTNWSEVYEWPFRTHNCVGWSDEDTSGDLTVGDIITTADNFGITAPYLVDHVGTDVIVDQIGVICDTNPDDPFYGIIPIVGIAGFPHPERGWCPWHYSDSAVPLPHVVKDGVFESFFKPPGAWIDIFTDYPAPYGGQGPNVPSDMYWPQKGFYLYAYVTYNFWPEQNKDVAFEIKDPQHNVWAIEYARTNSTGYAWVFIRLPWPCDNPESYFGEWTIVGTVDVACLVVEDIMPFKYDYLVNLWDVTTDKDTYAHCEDIKVTVDFGSYAMQYYNVLITVTIVDETGVPFAFAYVWVVIGGAEYCTYNNDQVILTVHVEKFARAGVAKILVGALSDFPQEGGCALCALFEPIPEVGILAEWAP